MIVDIQLNKNDNSLGEFYSQTYIRIPMKLL